jgi:hypothetical protein
LNQNVDDVAAEIERPILQVVASTSLQVRVRRKTSRETIALTSSDIAQELAFSARLSVCYPDELGAALDADGGAPEDHEHDCKAIGDLHIDLDSTQICLESPAGVAAPLSMIELGFQLGTSRASPRMSARPSPFAFTDFV